MSTSSSKGEPVEHLRLSAAPSLPSLDADAIQIVSTQLGALLGEGRFACIQITDGLGRVLRNHSLGLVYRQQLTTASPSTAARHILSRARTLKASVPTNNLTSVVIGRLVHVPT